MKIEKRDDADAAIPPPFNELAVPAGLSDQEAENGRWKPRQITAAESLDQSAQMAERWQKLFVRALRALRDLRRHAPPMVLAGPGSQVNVANQQINTRTVSAGD